MSRQKHWLNTPKWVEGYPVPDEPINMNMYMSIYKVLIWDIIIWVSGILVGHGIAVMQMRG